MQNRKLHLDRFTCGCMDNGNASLEDGRVDKTEKTHSVSVLRLQLKTLITLFNSPRINYC